MTTPYYAQKLQETFDLKRQMNPKYSLRAYARFLGMHPSSLSHVLKSQRKPTISQVQKIAKKLELGAKEQFLFYGSLEYTINGMPLHQPNIDCDKLLDEDTYFNVLANWEYTAVMALINALPKTKMLDNNLFQKKFNFKNMDVQKIIDDLILMELIEINPETGYWQCTSKNFYSSQDITSRALRKFHKDNLAMAAEKLENVELELRDFSSRILSISPNKIGLAKQLIKNFRKSFEEIMSIGQDEKEVFQISIQLYPLSNIQLNSNIIIQEDVS